MQYIIWTFAEAAGILSFIFLWLLFWDVSRFLPMPWRAFYGPQPSGKQEMKILWFVIGIAATIGMFWAVNDPQNFGCEWLLPYLPSSYITWIFFIGIPAPIVGLFLFRIVLALACGIYALYQRSELLYERGKTALLKQLRRKGRIE